MSKVIQFFKKNDRWQGVAGLLMLVLAFATGRYTTPTKIETKTITVEVEHHAEEIKKDTVTVEVINPDGTKTTTTTDKTETTSTTDTEHTKTDTKLVENKPIGLNISALVGTQIFHPTLLGKQMAAPDFVYGISFTKTLFGPLSIGFWALSNSTVGSSIGIQF